MRWFHTLKTHHLIALAFAVAVIILIASVRVTPYLFPPRDWIAKSIENTDPTVISAAQQTLNSLAGLSTKEQWEEYCRNHTQSWMITDGSAPVFTCQKAAPLPLDSPLLRIPPLSLDIPDMTVSLSLPSPHPAATGSQQPQSTQATKDRSLVQPRRWFSPRGRPWRRAIALLQIDRTDRTYILALPWSNVFTTPFNYGPILFLGSVALTLLLVLLVIFERMLAPFADIERTLAEYSRGNFNSRPRVRGTRELRRITEGLGMMAEKLDHLIANKNRLLIDISHELKTPLARLRVHCALAKDETEVLDLIDNDACEMAQIVERILDDARATWAIPKLNVQQIDLEALLRTISARVQQRFTERNTAFTLNIVAPNFPTGFLVDGEEALLRSAIENVIDNAAKYCAIENGQVTLTLSQPNDRILLTVHDNGPGISAHFKDLIFEPFFRIDESRTRTSGGHGLGLSIAHRIVRTHGGTLTLDDSSTVGATFQFSFPKSDALTAHISTSTV